MYTVQLQRLLIGDSLTTRFKLTSFRPVRMGSSESKSKAVGGTVGGATSVGLVAGGVALSIFGGPVGAAFGLMMMTGGVSSAGSTIKQCVTDGDFDYGQWGMDTLGGAADGADPRGTPVAIADSHNDD